MARQQELVESLFEAALALGPEEQQAYLDEVCSGDQELRHTVDDLLAQDARAGSFLQHSPFGLFTGGLNPGAGAVTQALAAPGLGDDLIGRTLSHFQITAAIGAGGMGEVFRATDKKLGRDVALKVLSLAMAGDAKRLARFRLEARAVAALNHPNIVTLYSLEEAEGLHFLTMELIEGEPLHRLIPPGGLPASQVIAIANALVDALTAAHERDIVHRDLKPANVMVTNEGRVKVLDFGLAKETSATMSVTGTTVVARVMGTPGHMSPEQVRGQTVDHRTDIFSLGILLYEMATGRQPFRKSTAAETMTAILNEEPTPISELAPRTPAALQSVVRRCLEKDPAQRFPSASDLAFALESLTERQFVRPRRLPRRGRTA